jgi:hypothetical protein
MDCKVKQNVCIKFCMKLGKATTKTLEILCEAFGMAFTFPRLVECQLKMANVQGDQAPAKPQKMLKNSRTHQ